MHINIKDGIPANIALTAVLAVVNQALVVDSEGNCKPNYPLVTIVPVRRIPIKVEHIPNRKTDCFRVSIKKD